MAQRRTSIHGQWSSRWAFILAATGSAVGLGNIWKFPYITGEYGGGAFVLVYLVCVALIGLPIMIAEILLGRRGRQSPINTMRALSQEAGHNGFWQFIGWGGVVAGFLILSYYSVIAGWAVAYVFRSAGGVFSGQTAEGIRQIFSSFVQSPERVLAWHTIFMIMTAVVVARGVRSGLESAVRVLMPALFVLLLTLVGYAMNTDSFMDGARFMFQPDFSKLSGEAVLVAMGHAFFTLSLGMGAIMVYGSYLPEHASITRSAMAIAVADTVVALLAGLAIFPLVFANGLQPGVGPSLIFQTLPIAFGRMPGGAVFGSLFFILLTFAAWTSAISLIEPAVAWLVENRGLSRVAATVWCALGSWLLGLGTIFSFNLWSGWKLVGERNFFDVMDFLTANIMLPLGGFFIAVFAGWVLTRAGSVEELGIGGGPIYRAWHFIIRYVAPLGVIVIFLKAIGVFGQS